MTTDKISSELGARRRLGLGRLREMAMFLGPPDLRGWNKLVRQDMCVGIRNPPLKKGKGHRWPSKVDGDRLVDINSRLNAVTKGPRVPNRNSHPTSDRNGSRSLRLPTVGHKALGTTSRFHRIQFLNFAPPVLDRIIGLRTGDE